MFKRPNNARRKEPSMVDVKEHGVRTSATTRKHRRWLMLVVGLGPSS